MPTLAGTEEELVPRLNSVLQVEIEVIAAYEEALRRVRDDEQRERYRLFLGDHRRHARRLGELVRQAGGTPVAWDDLRDPGFRARQVRQDASDDVRSLRLMLHCDETAHDAYYQARQHRDTPLPTDQVLEEMAVDEHGHCSWMSEHLRIHEQGRGVPATTID